MEFGYCNICKKHLLGYDEYVLKNGKKICKNCLEAQTKNSEMPDYNNLLEYIKSLFHKNEVPETWKLFIDKQRKMGKTYSGMQGSLYYFYEILNNPVDYEAMNSIGIIEYVYDDARKHFEELERVNFYNTHFKDTSTTKTYSIKTPETKKHKINIEDL